MNQVIVPFNKTQVTVTLDPVFEKLALVLPIVSKLFDSNAEEGATINSRDLHAALEIGRDHATWIKATIKLLRLVEGVHYTTLTVDASNSKNWPEIKANGGRARTDYFVLLNSAQHIAALTNSEAAYNIREYLFAVAKATMSTVLAEHAKQIAQKDRNLAFERSEKNQFADEVARLAKSKGYKSATDWQMQEQARTSAQRTATSIGLEQNRVKLCLRALELMDECGYKPQTCKNVANMMQAELDRSYREHECISDPF